MKELLILRHAKSSWDQPGLADHDRPLNARGRADAPRMGLCLREEGLLPDLIVSSTAVRAQTTARAAASAAGYDGDIVLTRAFFHAAPEEYMEQLQRLPSAVERVLIVGHNPGLEELVELLCGELVQLPTATLVRLTLPIDAWENLDEETEAELMQVWRPRDLAA